MNIKTSPYHPHAREKSNKILYKKLRETIISTTTYWDDKLWGAPWAYRTAYRGTTTFTFFQLIYGQEAILPIEFETPSLRIAIEKKKSREEGSLKIRLTNLETLNEKRREAYLNTFATQN